MLFSDGVDLLYRGDYGGIKGVVRLKPQGRLHTSTPWILLSHSKGESRVRGSIPATATSHSEHILVFHMFFFIFF